MIQFWVFGTPQLRNGKGTDLHSVLAHSKHVGLLAHLLFGRRALHSRDKLTALFWPELNDKRARNALSKALHHLRRALGDDLFAVNGNEAVGLNETEIWCDVAAFETAIKDGRHAEAIGLFRRGELLEGLTLSDAPEFEHWVDRERLRLRQHAVDSAAALGDAEPRAGNQGAAAEWAAVGCELSPHDEIALRRRLVAMDRAGDRAGALKVYQAFAALIARDLEVEPAPETQALVESLRVSSPPPGRSTPVLEPAIDVERSVAPPSQRPAERADETTVETLARPRFRYRHVFAAVGFALVIVVAGMMYLNRTRERPGLVAVGPLRNRTGDTALGPLADLATGNIVEQLTQSGQDVVDLRRFPGRQAPGSDSSSETTRQLARELGAGSVVGGDIYSRGDSLVVHMQIVDASSGRVLHQLDPVAAPLTNSFTILDRLRGGVNGAIAALADTLYLPWSTAHSRPPNYAAFQEFMQGLDGLVHQSAQRAVAHLEKAVALDTGFVEAKIWLLEQADLLGDRTLVDSISAAALAQRDRLGPFDRISLDRELAFLNGRLEESYSAARRLVAIAPKTPDALIYLAQAAMATRRYPEAIQVLHHMDRTRGWLKDLSQVWQWDLQAHRLLGDAAGAMPEWRRVRARIPDDYGACSAGISLLASLGREEDVNALIGECAGLSSAPPTMERAYEVAGRNYRSRGHAAAARRAFDRALVVRTAAAKADPRRRRFLGVLQCEVGDWRAGYGNLKATADTSSIDDRVSLAVASAHVGDTATVNATLRWIDQWRRSIPARGQDKMHRAFIVLARGDRNEAIELLRRAIDEGTAPAWSAWYVRYELQPLHGDPRFEELVRPQT